MTKLVGAVRRVTQDHLGEPPGLGAKLDLAQVLRLADTEGRLAEVLMKALVLDDEDSERLLRDHGPDAPGSP